MDHQPDDSVDDGLPSGRRPTPPKRLKPTLLRIVAGQLRSRRITYNGDPATRPMKEKTREAVFSVLGGYLNDTYCIDLFGGTGVLAFEAISRGSVGATILELSRPAINTMLDNMRVLKLTEHIELQNVDTLRWLKTAEFQTARLPRCPWVIFCCPPYAMWSKQEDRLLDGLNLLLQSAPVDSRLVCETLENYDLAGKMDQFQWDVRRYKPASVSFTTRPSP